MILLCAGSAAWLIPAPTVSAATGWYFGFNVVRQVVDRHVLREEGDGMSSTDWESHFCGAVLGAIAGGCCADSGLGIDAAQALAIITVFVSAMYDR